MSDLVASGEPKATLGGMEQDDDSGSDVLARELDLELANYCGIPCPGDKKIFPHSPVGNEVSSDSDWDLGLGTGESLSLARLENFASTFQDGAGEEEEIEEDVEEDGLVTRARLCALDDVIPESTLAALLKVNRKWRTHDEKFLNAFRRDLGQVSALTNEALRNAREVGTIERDARILGNLPSQRTQRDIASIAEGGGVRREEDGEDLKEGMKTSASNVSSKLPGCQQDKVDCSEALPPQERAPSPEAINFSSALLEEQMV